MLYMFNSDDISFRGLYPLQRVFECLVNFLFYLSGIMYITLTPTSHRGKQKKKLPFSDSFLL